MATTARTAGSAGTALSGQVAVRGEARGRRPWRRFGRYLVLWLVGGIVAALIVIPLAYAVLDGFKTNGELVGNPALLPNDWITTNYSDILGSIEFWRVLGNSLLVSAV